MKYYALLLTAFLFVACGPQKGRLRIRGKFENLPQADLLLYSPDGGLENIDTLHIMKGQFEYQTRINGGPYTYVIVYPNFSTLGFQAHSGSDIRIKGDALSLSQVHVEGADSILTQEVKSDKKPLSIGKKLPKSKLIHHKNGTYLLIAFWANWRIGGNNINHNIRQALDAHPDSLYAFTYCLDINPENNKIAESIEDTTRWHTYCDYTGWNSALLTKYGIRNIPYFILAGPKGTILAMGSDYNRDIKPALPVQCQ